MNSLLIAKVEIRGQRGLGLPTVRVILEGHLRVLHAPPQPLDEHVVDRSAATIHTDRHAVRVQPRRERRGRELASLIGVEELGGRSGERFVERLFQRLQAEAAG